MPAALAVRIINEAGPDAKLSLLPPQRVAGQSAAGLAVRPASPQSTIAQADIWASPATGLPLLVQVFGRGGRTRRWNRSSSRPAPGRPTTAC